MTWKDRLPIALLIALTIVLRSLIPAGYMPDIEAMADHRLILTICHGGETPAPGTPGDGPQSAPCPFAAFSYASLLTGDARPVLPARIGYHDIGLWHPVAAPATTRGKHLPLGARAPPFLSA